jgi:hypothetical protein
MGVRWKPRKMVHDQQAAAKEDGGHAHAASMVDGMRTSNTTGIRLFVECSVLCRVFFVGHSAKPSLSSVTLGKVLLSVTTTFTESRTLGTRRHLAKTTLSSAKHSAKSNARQRAVSSRL